MSPTAASFLSPKLQIIQPSPLSLPPQGKRHPLSSLGFHLCLLALYPSLALARGSTADGVGAPWPQTAGIVQARRPRPGYSVALSLTWLTCKMGMRTVSTWWGCRDERVNAGTHLEQGLADQLSLCATISSHVSPVLEGKNNENDWMLPLLPWNGWDSLQREALGSFLVRCPQGHR